MKRPAATARRLLRSPMLGVGPASTRAVGRGKLSCKWVAWSEPPAGNHSKLFAPAEEPSGRSRLLGNTNLGHGYSILTPCWDAAKRW